ncbi:MAG: hypothetical protein KJ587_08875, partial [Alphaproteobacteria bacterium]|nr:hypothetical protein [Alphaproteobacteria bacterium]
PFQKGAKLGSSSDHPAVLNPLLHRPVAITGTGGRDQPESMVAINRNQWSQWPGMRSHGSNRPPAAADGARATSDLTAFRNTSFSGPDRMNNL